MKPTDNHPVKITIANDVTFFGCPEEANPVSLYFQVTIQHHLLRELSGRRVVVRATGNAKVFWDEECSYFAIMASKKNLLVMEQPLPLSPDLTPCPAYNELFNMHNNNSSSRLLGYRDNHHHHHSSTLSPQYMHSFPLQFQLQGHLPSSFHHSSDVINYSIDVVLLHDSGEEVLASEPFEVRRCMLPSLLPSLLNPITPTDNSVPTPYTPITNDTLTSTTTTDFNQFNWEEEKWMGIFEGLQYCVVAPTCLVLGQPELNFKLILGTPATSYSSIYLTTTFKQQIACQINDLGTSRLFQKRAFTTISKTNPHQKVNLPTPTTTLHFTLPLTTSSTNSSSPLFEDLDCDLIRIDHFLKLTLKLSRFASKKLELTIPITVTSRKDLPPPYC